MFVGPSAHVLKHGKKKIWVSQSEYKKQSEFHYKTMCEIQIPH